MGVEPNLSYGKDIRDLNSTAVCITTGLATIPTPDRIEGYNIPPISLDVSAGCASLPDGSPIPDGMFVVKGEITTDGSNDIQLSYSGDFGSTYYTDEFPQAGLYLAVFMVNYAAAAAGVRRLEQNELTNTLDGLIADPENFSFPLCLKGAPSSEPTLALTDGPTLALTDGPTLAPTDQPTLAPSTSFQLDL